MHTSFASGLLAPHTNVRPWYRVKVSHGPGTCRANKRWSSHMTYVGITWTFVVKVACISVH